MGPKNIVGEKGFEIDIIEAFIIAKKVVLVIWENSKIVIELKSKVQFKSVVNSSQFDPVNKVKEVQISWVLEVFIVKEGDWVGLEMGDIVSIEKVVETEIV